MSDEEQRAYTPSERMARRLAAIFSADVKGYSRLMGDDELATVRTLTAYREVLTTLIQTHRGRVVDSPGDNLLAEFASVVDAVQCATEIQHEIAVRNAEVPTHRQMAFRIGINVGDVLTKDGRLYGDGVNIAARLEGLAEAGGICISEAAYTQVKNKLALGYQYIGEQQVKNIVEPVRVYKVLTEPDAATTPATSQVSPVQRLTIEKPSSRQWLWMAVTAVALLCVGVGGVMLRRSYAPSFSPSASVPVKEASSLPLPDKPSIVVLPFVNMSKDPEQEYFSDGLTEVLTGALSKISSLFVIARNSAFTYKGKAVKVQDVGREMGVRYVLEGSVQKADQQVRIAAQLIEAETGYHLWSEQYDRPFKDIFALQDEIVQKIVTTLKLQLTLQEQGYIVHKHTDNLEAYDAFLRGVEYFWRFAKETNAQARQLFEQAIALDPQYAEAYARLGWTYWLEWDQRWSVDPQTLERAMTLAQQALALDDTLPAAHSGLSYVYASKQQPDQAIAEGERAIALDPNNADSYALQAQVLIFAGRPKDVLRAVAQAMRLNPHYPPWYVFELGTAYLLTGQYAEAIGTLQEAIRRNPNVGSYYLRLAASYRWQWLSQQSPTAQTLEPAVAAAQRALTLNDSDHWVHINLASLSLYQQQYEQARTEMERAVALAPTVAESYAALAEVLSYMGRSEEALAAAAQALRLKAEFVDDHLASVGSAYAVAGRYEEARAPLQRYLSRYPNILPAHLMLAAVYSELGQATDARTEAAEVLRLNPKFSLEVYKQREPIKDPAVLERHIAALKKAGLK